MIKRFQPELVSIEGDGYLPTYSDIAEMFGIDIDDVAKIDMMGGEIDVNAFEEKYPEYMGIAPAIIAKVIQGVAGIGSGIASLVKGIKDSKKKKSSDDAAKKAAAAAAALKLEQEAAAAKKAEDNKKMIMLAGVGALGLLALIALKK